MAIKTPKWAQRSGAYPTKQGWTVDRSKGKTEVVKAAKFSAEEIAEWHGASTPAPVIQTLHEAPVVETVVDEATVEFHYGEDVTDVDYETPADLKDIG